jgi:hypothetical protein
MKCYAYTDESGHSGLELFRTDQESFWTGTLIAFSDVDVKYARFHKELLDTVGKTELHGNELGFGRIEKIAGRLSWFIREKKIHFSFGRVHKPFLAATKLFDFVFDSGSNKAMPTIGYNVRHLRLINLMHFVQLLEEGDLEEFWAIFTAQDAERFGIFLKGIAGRIQSAPYDKRSLQILSDVLNWGSQHPEAVLDPFGEGDSPNFVAFTNLFSHLHNFHKEYGHVVGSFVHDEQDEFVPSFRTAYDFLSKFEQKDGPTSLMPEINKIPSFNCELEVRSSVRSFGLQIVDVCLWLIRRVMERKDKPRGNCKTLTECLIERSWLSQHCFETVIEQVKAGTDFLQKLPLSEADLKRGRELLNQLETSRQARIKAVPQV